MALILAQPDRTVAASKSVAKVLISAPRQMSHSSSACFADALYRIRAYTPEKKNGILSVAVAYRFYHH
jgi:hypothetical protein